MAETKSGGVRRQDDLAKRPGESDEQSAQRTAIARRLAHIRRKVIVLSGKGGVGKSTVAANIAVAAAQAGVRTGLLDVDIHGPSIPRLLGLEGVRASAEGDHLLPVPAGENLKVMSIGFLVGGRDQPIIWRGPMKFSMIRQFLADVDWGELDLLVIDCPPGTGDEPLSVVQLIRDADGAIVVTTPQKLAVDDVRRAVTFCRELSLPILGVIENMSGFACPKCGEVSEVFGSGGGESMAADMQIPFIGRIPIDPRISASGDAGRPAVAEAGAVAGAEVFLRAAEIAAGR